MITPQDRELVTGIALGDGCLKREPKFGSVTLYVSHAARQAPYAAWKLAQMNRICGTKASLNSFNDKGRYPAVRFGVTSKRILTPIHNLLYPSGVKRFSPEVFDGLGLQALALFWMDDGSLEVRRRKRPRSIKYERTGWLPVSKDLREVEIVADWIESLTGARAGMVAHSGGMLYLRWYSRQCRLLVSAIDSLVHPCVKYKVDLTRTGTVADWLSESQRQNSAVDDKAA